MDTHMSYKVLYSEQEKYTNEPRNRTLPINCIYPYSSYVIHISISLPFTRLGRGDGHAGSYLLSYK